MVIAEHNLFSRKRVRYTNCKKGKTADPGIVSKKQGKAQCKEFGYLLKGIQNRQIQERQER